MIADITIKKNKQANIINPVFSILIPSWNNLAYLKLCIESIRKNSHFKHQIIVHLNESRDGSLEWIRTQPDIDFTFSEQNIGVCYALNLGRELVAAEYILYMNDDMYACPGWDLELMQEIKQIGHPYFFISGTAIEPKETGNPCVLVMDFGNDIHSFREDKLLQEFSTPSLSDWQGSTWPPNIVHRDVWDLVGGYSVEFTPGMYSDPDFSMKLWGLGIRLFKGIGKSRVYHFGSKSTRRVRKNRGYFQFLQKWGMTSSTLTRFYLRRGKTFDGPLREPVLPWGIKIKNYWKRIQAAIVHNGNN
jgi:glycosyltransferase involved in cell wall biosynthesis